MALLEPSRPALGSSIQIHPQNPPPILRAFRHGRRVRITDRSHDPRVRYCRNTSPILRHDKRPPHPDDVRLDRIPSLPSHRRALRLRPTVQSTQVVPILGRRRLPRPPPREVHRQLRQLFPVVGLDLRHGAKSRGVEEAEGEEDGEVEEGAIAVDCTPYAYIEAVDSRLLVL